MSSQGIQPGQILEGSLFPEPMRVETAQQGPDGIWTLGLVGLSSERFRRVSLTASDLQQLRVRDASMTYDGDGALLRLGLEACVLGIAYEFDPYFALSVSRVDPLPHQLEAVYDYLLKAPRIRFLLADDAGAGKTVMAGLLTRELKLRGLAERILVVCPANLTFQWQRELKEKFDETFVVLKGSSLREQFGVNQWLEHAQVITSQDLAKRAEILPGLRQVHWDLVVVDEAHRMSWTPPGRKTDRYALGELLRDNSDHLLLLTATPHKGDPENFSLFLQLLDPDAFAEVRSIREAMARQRAPFYLRRTKEAMVYFPERQPDGRWVARKIFTRRVPHTVEFQIDAEEFVLYREVTRYVKEQSARAAALGDDRRSRAIAFLMALYQRRLASSTYGLRRSLENRTRRLADEQRRLHELARQPLPELPEAEELEEFEEAEQQHLEERLQAVTLACSPAELQEELARLKQLIEQAKRVEEGGREAKLAKLKELLRAQGFFDTPDQRLLIFTEFRDTLEYLVAQLAAWGFRVGYIHGSMAPGSRNEPGTRLYAEQLFKEGDIQILVATEAAGEGINLQCCHILFNYDIPWNPNRLEQRMGRIHRYGQRHDCLIFNFVATNTIEGSVLQRLLHRLQEIRDALDDDAVFNVVGEILPAALIERVLRDYYAGRLADGELEGRLLQNVDEEHFRASCQNALEGLATRQINLEMLVERRARARERRLVPEAVARFLQDAAGCAQLALRPVRSLPHTFEPVRIPGVLHEVARRPDWRLPPLAMRYPRWSTDREMAEKHQLEWVTPGHPLFEAVRRHILEQAQPSFRRGACFYSLRHPAPARLDVYRAQVVDGLGQRVHERLFVVELREDASPRLLDPSSLANLQPAPAPQPLPGVAGLPEALPWLHENALTPFLEDIRRERLGELERVAEHIELSLTELIHKVDEQIGRLVEAVQRGEEGAEGRLAQAEDRHAQLVERRRRRREGLERQRSLTLQGVERIATALVLPHPEREAPEVRRLWPDPRTEAIAMEVAMAYERVQGRQVFDVHERNLGYDLTSIDLNSGELRLIEVKGLAGAQGRIPLSPNERRVAEDRRDCYWLYVVTECASEPKLQAIPDPARFPWHEVTKVAHYWLDIDALRRPMRLRDDRPPYPNPDSEGAS